MMSEIIEAPKTPKSRLIVILFLSLSILILFLIYGAGVIGLPVLILSKYQNRDCDSVLTVNKIYTILYPRFIEDQTLLTPVHECDAYLSALAKEAAGSWREAYDAYQAYASAYPNGLYATEAHQRSAAALLSLAHEQVEQREFAEALASLHLIVAGYSDTAVITDAWHFFPAVYAPWGAGLREAGDFAKSEEILNEFKTWSLTNHQTDAATTSQRELTQTYLAWGLELRSQAQFETAIAKFELAAAADPESQFDSAPKVSVGQSSTYIDWGNDLLGQDQFPVAISKFELAVSKSLESNDDSAADALANGQIQWAHDFSAQEDFQAALEHLQFAEEAAATDAMKRSVEDALQDTYLAFSKSSGPQARRAMKDVLTTVCKDRKEPDLPIFGLNQESVRFAIFGVDDQLPENLTAKTPGEMHFIACITPDNRTVETRMHKRVVLDFGRIQYYVLVEQFRVQLIWDAHLLQTDSGKSVAEQTLMGMPPPPFAEDAGDYFYGPAPMEELAKWLESMIH
jgi:tetratricopeptide (TPR) repeat protein